MSKNTDKGRFGNGYRFSGWTRCSCHGGVRRGGLNGTRGCSRCQCMCALEWSVRRNHALSCVVLRWPVVGEVHCVNGPRRGLMEEGCSGLMRSILQTNATEPHFVLSGRRLHLRAGSYQMVFRRLPSPALALPRAHVGPWNSPHCDFSYTPTAPPRHQPPGHPRLSLPLLRHKPLEKLTHS